MKTKCLTGCLFSFCLTISSAQTYTFSTIAGTAGQAGNADGTGAVARFRKPCAIALDNAGNVYVADTDNHTIRKITAAGVVTTLAGSAGQVGSADGAGSTARFNVPRGIVVDGAGNVYVADRFGRTIRKITPDGIVSTLAGSAGQSEFVDGRGATARFLDPRSLAIDRHGNLYVVDTDLAHAWGRDRIRKITASGEVSTLAGMYFNEAMAVAVDDDDALYVADLVDGYMETLRIRRITAGGNVTAFPTATNYISYEAGLAVDSRGHVFVAENGTGEIREITPGGLLSLVGGRVLAKSDGRDGPGSTATFNGPQGVAVDGAGNLYITDTYNHTIRKGVPVPTIDVSTVITNQYVTRGHGASLAVPRNITGDIQWQVQANDGSWNNTVDSPFYSGVRSRVLTITSVSNTATYRFVVTEGRNAPIASTPYTVGVQSNILPHPTGLTTAGRMVYITDSSLNAVCLFDAYPYGTNVYFLAGSVGSKAGTEDGNGDNARFNQPGGISAASDGTVTVADTANGTIRRVTRTGQVTTFAGSAVNRGNVDATGTAATFSSPRDVAQDSNGTIYVADSLNHTIRKITPGGVVTTFAGKAGTAGSADGLGLDARFNNPCGVSVDASGNVYVSDTTNNTIRKITSAGSVTTLAGLFGVAGYDDGVGVDARFNRPIGMTQDASGNLYVTDTGNSTIRKITPNGTVSTLAGLPTIAGLMDGQGTDALFNQPEAICLITYYAQPALIVADTGNAIIRTVSLNGNVFTLEMYWAGAFNPVTPPAPTSTPPLPPPPTPPSSNTASSSGGGALDGWLAGLLGLMFLARWSTHLIRCPTRSGTG